MEALFIEILLKIPWIYLAVEVLWLNKNNKHSVKRVAIESVICLIIYLLVYIFTDFKTNAIVSSVFVLLILLSYTVIKRFKKKSKEE